MKKRKRTKENTTRETLPKAIAAAFKSGDKATAMRLAIHGKADSARRCLLFGTMTDLVGDLAFLCKVSRDSDLQKEVLPQWIETKLHEIECEFEIHAAWEDRKWFNSFDRELKRVSKEGANPLLFSQFGTKQNPRKNPNWFRQILIANQGPVKFQLDKESKTLRERKPHPLFDLAGEYGIEVKSLRREARKMGIKPGKAGRPKTRKPVPLI